MRFRTVLGLSALALTLRSAAACSLDVGPGAYCQDSWFADYRCPDGYVCNDSDGWTCTRTAPVEEPAEAAPDQSVLDAG